MAYFDWRSIPEDDQPNPWVALARRFDRAEGATGIHLWQGFVEALQGVAGRPSEASLTDEVLGVIDGFIARAGWAPRPSTPTLFVSHQWKDDKLAERVAWEAKEVGFDYWLDVHDTKLTAVTSAALPVPIKAALITGIIEVALLNSTHLVGLQTTNSQTSRWVPYEFGRAKDRRMISDRTASWFQTGVGLDPNGDYLAFAECCDTDSALYDWLKHAAARAKPSRVPALWRGGRKPADLPN
jgi:hypothetical protein